VPFNDQRRASRTQIAFGIAAATVALFSAGSVSGSYAGAAGSDVSVVDECQKALGYAGRTAADLAWLHQCVSALTPPIAPPPTTPPPPPSTTPPPPPPTSDWPMPSTTGVPDGTVLSPAAECTLRTNNQVIVGKVFTCEVNIYATGVVIRDSLIRGAGLWGAFVRPGGSASFDHVTVQPATGCNGEAALTGSHFSAHAVKVMNWGDAFFLEGGGVSITDSYAKMCAPRGFGFHSDGVQGYHAGADVVVRHNHLDQRCSDQTHNPQDRACDVTAPVFWGDDSGDRLRFQDNLVRGGGHSIRIHSGSGHIVTGNVVDRAWQFGPVYSHCSHIADWSGNRTATVTDAGVASNFAPLPCTGAA
jgi:hypothetical protein